MATYWIGYISIVSYLIFKLSYSSSDTPHSPYPSYAILVFYPSIDLLTRVNDNDIINFLICAKVQMDFLLPVFFSTKPTFFETPCRSNHIAHIHINTCWIEFCTKHEAKQAGPHCNELAPAFSLSRVRAILVTISCSSGMGAASHPLSHLFLMFCLLVGGRVLLSDHEVDLFKSIYFFLFGVSVSQATKCKYECEQTGGCTAKYFGPPRSGNTIVSLPNLLVNRPHSRVIQK